MNFVDDLIQKSAEIPGIATFKESQFRKGARTMPGALELLPTRSVPALAFLNGTGQQDCAQAEHQRARRLGNRLNGTSMTAGRVVVVLAETAVEFAVAEVAPAGSAAVTVAAIVVPAGSAVVTVATLVVLAVANEVHPTRIGGRCSQAYDTCGHCE